MKSIDTSHSNRSFDEWLSYIERIHATEIDMGLTRISNVANRLGLNFERSIVITVAGTNGKGTTCAFIENALLANNDSVAVYSSPHIHRFNERLRIDKQDIDDNSLVNAFEQIEFLRGDISLTYYEYTTLAALTVLNTAKPQYIILEVGLGGRLDATNIIDADIAVITTVDLDHQAFLGNDRESIGFEKAGIMRTEKPVVIGDSNPPSSVIKHADTLSSIQYCRNKEFFVIEDNTSWQWHDQDSSLNNLPQGFIPKDNIATALQVLKLLDYPLSQAKVTALINETKVSGRTELIQCDGDILLDVGHNPLAARYLAEVVSKYHCENVYAVIGMLSDKDISSTITPLLPHIKTWFVSGLGDVPRGASKEYLASYFTEQNILTFDNVIDGFKMARSTANNRDLILVFGSFYTVAKVKTLLDRS
ncbi:MULTISPECIES: bifunctional tetrahydrofolate synthase/dihydrofolate synthase [Thalassotalea]|uniref:bifunctional tetrahydrofolate synthase/dihydrofolate synthase n=1 Tax=Thalassotalea TaxID=1518149 RepID=UPI0009436569|nr:MULTISPECIES: bifunctional tetrahydrofolate synthase/dihydrofolate synthase [Thalassotalea]OKY25384.1 folC bifunctional protein [Thalassotalea sp. PP2-459]